MKTFNRNRLHIACQDFLASGSQRVLAPNVCNKQEPVLVTVKRFFNKIDLGCSASCFKKIDSSIFERLSSAKYFTKFDLRSKIII